MNKSKVLHIFTGLCKAISVAVGFNQIPFIPQEYAVLIFMLASLLKDALIGIGDFLDDGKINKSFRPIALGLVLALTLALGSGCSNFYSRQWDRSYFGPDGKTLARSETETLVRARTVWDAKSQLANFTASQSAKTQSTKVGALVSESTASNAVPVLRELRGIVEALPK